MGVIYVHVCLYAHKSVNVCVHMSVCVFICVPICLHVCKHVFALSLCICYHMCMFICMYLQWVWGEAAFFANTKAVSDIACYPSPLFFLLFLFHRGREKDINVHLREVTGFGLGLSMKSPQ